MGVNFRVILPPNVRVKDVATVIGKCAGLPCQKRELGRGHHYALVDGVKVESTCVPEMVAINLKHSEENCFPDGIKHHVVYYHFEGVIECGDFGCPPQFWGCPVMTPKSTLFWCAVMTKVVKFFGGWLSYQDRNENFDLVVPYNENNAPSNGDAWNDFQDRILEIEPITADEMNSFEGVTAYN